MSLSLLSIPLLLANTIYIYSQIIVHFHAEWNIFCFPTLIPEHITIYLDVSLSAVLASFTCPASICFSDISISLYMAICLMVSAYISLVSILNICILVSLLESSSDVLLSYSVLLIFLFVTLYPLSTLH